jgi:hypothetical protein
LWGPRRRRDRLNPNEGAGRFGADRSRQGNFRATTKAIGENADLVYKRKALQVGEKRLFTLLSIIVTDSVASNMLRNKRLINLQVFNSYGLYSHRSYLQHKQSSKTSCIFLGCLAPFESVLGQVIDTSDFDLSHYRRRPDLTMIIFGWLSSSCCLYSFKLCHKTMNSRCILFVHSSCPENEPLIQTC